MKPMKVSELVSALKEQDQSAYVALSTDSEGNSYSLMPNEMFVTTEAYLEKSLGGQDQYFEIEELKDKGDTVTNLYGNKVDKKKLTKCIILWPSN